MPWSLLHLECSVNEQKGFFLTFPCQPTAVGWVPGASGGVLFLGTSADAAVQAMHMVVPVEDASVARQCGTALLFRGRFY